MTINDLIPFEQVLHHLNNHQKVSGWVSCELNGVGHLRVVVYPIIESFLIDKFLGFLDDPDLERMAIQWWEAKGHKKLAVKYFDRWALLVRA
jgi:hypothetical protein